MKRCLRLILLPIIAGLTVLLSMASGVSAYTGGSVLPGWGNNADKALKAGPLGVASAGNAGEVPVAISIPDAGVDNAQVETNQIVNGMMLDPSSSMMVTWYPEMGKAGDTLNYRNMVIAGHVDNWDIGPAIFKNLTNLGQGSEIDVTGANGDVFTYIVSSLEQVPADPSAEQLQSLVAPHTSDSVLTIITCGGVFNSATGHYESRTIVHATLTGEQKGVAQPQTPQIAKDLSGPADGLQMGDFAKSVDDGINIRIQPSTGSGVAAELTKGEEVLLMGGAIQADGYTWWPVVTKDFSATGWVAADFLQK